MGAPPRRRHGMETGFHVTVLYEENQVRDSPHKGLVTRALIFFYISLNKPLDSSRIAGSLGLYDALWRHCNALC